ncbi:rhomboid-related protein 1-like isoform X1 [Mytilus edulis]|uniref:rhomboid-related protein 1-like isoform X1 n=1 Tax=Mytilus edulis TaxID=6550 RepID=UPI0039EFBD41
MEYRQSRSEIYLQPEVGNYRQPRSDIRVSGRSYRQPQQRTVQYITREQPRYIVRQNEELSPQYVVRERSRSPYTISNGQSPQYVVRERSRSPYMISNGQSPQYVVRGRSRSPYVISNGQSPQYVVRERSRSPYMISNGQSPQYVVRKRSRSPYMITNGDSISPQYISENPYAVKDRNILLSNGNTRYVSRYQPRPLTEMELDMYKRYKPIFDRHEPDGVPLNLLKEELKDEGITDHIPEARLHRILDRADRDGDERIDFVEFMKMMTTDVTKEERSAFQSVIGAAVADILPKSMREDFLANYTCRPPPIFMIFISLVEIIIFAVYAAELSDTTTPVTATSGVPLYSPLLYKPKRRYEAWRYITYMFIHQGYMHIIFNLIFQLLLGLPLELVHKWWRVLLIYVLGVIAGSLAHSVTDVDVALAGASGGCYALIGAHIASVIVNWKEMNYQCTEGSLLRFLCSAPIRLTVLLVLSVGDTGLAIYRRYFEEEVTKVGISAHIGGMIAGLLLGIPILKNVNILTWEKTLGYVTLSIYLCFVGFSMIFNGVYEGYPETDWSKCCPS